MTHAIKGRAETVFAGLRLANPVMPASGCFGPELADVIDLSSLGALVTKTVFSTVRSGNPSHRLTETALGMLNAVGIPSPGYERFATEVLPAYLAPGVPVVVSVGGLSHGEYFDIVSSIERGRHDVAAYEVNVSCPNLEHDGLEIGADPAQVEAVVRGLRDLTKRPLVVKLTPNVTRIADIARAAENGGADAVTVANTFVGMSVDVRRRHAVLGNTTGGLSGPAVKPMALRLVWQTAAAVSIPVIGCGGIVTATDAVEFLMAGASAVQVGTATFTRPDSMVRMVNELPALLEELGASSVADVVGSLEQA